MPQLPPPPQRRPALPVGAVPVQQEPVVKPSRHRSRSTGTAPPSRSRGLAKPRPALPRYIPPRPAAGAGSCAGDAQTQPRSQRSCLPVPPGRSTRKLRLDPCVPAAIPATRTGSRGGHPASSPRCHRDIRTPHPRRARDHPPPRSWGSWWDSCPGLPPVPSPRFHAALASPGDVTRPELSRRHPTTGHKVTQNSPQLWLSLCLSFPIAREGGAARGPGNQCLAGAGDLAPPWLWPPSRCLPRLGLGDPSQGAGRELGPSSSSWLSLLFFLSPLFFRSAPIKVVFPTRCWSRRPMMGRGYPAAPPAAPPSLVLPWPRASATVPAGSAPHPAPGGAAGNKGELGAGPSASPSPCSPSLHGSAHRGQAHRWGRWAGSRWPRQGRQPTGRWAAWREVARHGGRAKVGSGFSCSDCLSPPQRFLLPGRKPAAAAGSAMNYSGAEMALPGQGVTWSP